jgi:hypothetical protein
MKNLFVLFLVIAAMVFAGVAGFAQDAAGEDVGAGGSVQSFSVGVRTPAVSTARDPNSTDGPTLITVLPGNNSTSPNGRAPQGSRLYINGKYIITGSEMSASAFPNAAVTSIGWRWNVPSPPAAGAPNAQSVPTTGNLKVFLKDTTGDAVGLIGTFIDTNGTGYTKVIDATLNIPDGISEINIDVPVGGPGTSTYTYTPGNGVLVIFVYQTTTTLATPIGAPTVFCTNVLGSSILTYQSNTVNGTTGTASAFRPETRFGSAEPPLVDILQVPQVYALGKMPIPYANPQTIRAPITNVSASPVTFNVTLTVKNASGTVRFTDTQGITVGAGATQVVSFAPWSPSITEVDSIIVEVPVQTGETNTLNNRRFMIQTVNTNRFAYSQGPTPTGGVGFNGATGDFVARFTSGTSAVIDSIQVNFTGSGQPYRLGIWDATGPGNTPGTLLYQTAQFTSAVGVTTLPVGPVAVNGDFFLGVKQVGTTNIAFAYQNETPIRATTFYFTSPTGGTSWTDFAPNNPFRFMIEANIAPGTPMTYNSSTTTQNTNLVPRGGVNQHIIGIQVVTDGNLLPIGVTQFNLNTTGTTNTADISNAKIFYTGTSSVFAATNQFGSTFPSPSGSYNITGSQTLAPGTNYFWLTYDIPGGATIGNFADAECTSITVDGTPRTPTVTAPAGAREIRAPLSGDYTVGLGSFNRVTGRNLYHQTFTRRVMREVPIVKNTLKGFSNGAASFEVEHEGTRWVEVDEEYSLLMENGKPYTERLDAGGDFATLTEAVNTLNGLGVGGPVRLLLTDASYPSETFPITINITNVNALPNATNTVTIKPASGAMPTITGSAASNAILQVLNTNYIIIDGSNTNGGTTRDLTLTNTNTTVPRVIVLGSLGTTPVSNITVKNCILNNGATTSTALVVSDGMTVGSEGYFSNVSIENNLITKAFRGVFVAAGLGGAQQGSNLSLLNNSLDATGVDAIRLNGFYMRGVNGVTVRGNTIANFSGAEGENDRAIHLDIGTANAVVEKNSIHTIGYTGNEGWGAYGIHLSSTAASSSNLIKNNMVYNIFGDGFSYTSTAPFDNPIGIVLTGTQGGVKIYNNSINLYGNTLHDANALSAGIALGTGSTADVRNNVVVNNLGLLADTGYGAVGIWLQSASSQLAVGDYNDYFVNPSGIGVKAVGQIATTPSTTLAAWQAATGQEANSVEGDPLFESNTDLHITNLSSPASNAGAPLADVTDDFDGQARSATSPDIGADEFGATTVTISVPVAVNWNIVSLPVSDPIPDDSVKHLFTNSANPYAFAFQGGYVQRFTMSNGPGYWIKSTVTYDQDITGTPRDTLTVPVSSGWNMIGSISTQIDTSVAHVTPSVAGLRASAFFKYQAGYVIATTIDPGRGYWVKASANGSFFMHVTGPAGKSRAASDGRSIEELNTITIADANGGSQTLYFGADATGEIPSYDLPPLPPAGSFDARFTSAEGGMMVKTHPVEVSGVIEVPIAIQSSAYPLTVTWKVNGTDAVYELSGEGLAQTLQGEGTLRINGSDVNRLTLRVMGSGSGLPKEYALYQNYPNPFNPTTSIKFALPVESKVSAEIYNILGQRVATLVNGVLNAGYHTIEWNGTNASGQSMGSGVYFVRLSAEGKDSRKFTEVKKLLLLK